MADRSLRLPVRRILPKYKYPPMKEGATMALVMQQAETLSAEWALQRTSGTASGCAPWAFGLYEQAAKAAMDSNAGGRSKRV